MRKCVKIMAIFVWVILVLESFAQPSGKQLVVFTDCNSCISGDTVWFKVWVPNEFQKFGNVVHVQLDNAIGKLISGVAVKSENGVAEGFIPIPDSLSTGLYYVSSFLNAQRVEKEIPSIGKSLLVYNRFAENINQMPVPSNAAFKSVLNTIPELEFKLNRQSFKCREKVDGTIVVPGNVRLAILKAKMVDPFAKKNSGFIDFSLSQNGFVIPAFAENNGVLISGKISENNEAPQSGELVLLSITREPPYFDYYYSEPNGNFHFFLKDAVGKANVILQTAGLHQRNYKITLQQNALTQSKSIMIDTLFLKPDEYTFIENRLKNSFYKKLFHIATTSQTDEFSMPVPFNMPFYGPPTHRVVPDEFFDLPDFKEISRELLHGVQFRTRNDETTIRMLNADRGVFFEDEPLRLLNGVPVFKNSLLASLKSTDIRYIDVVQSERILGDMCFNGILSVLLNDYSNAWLAQQTAIFQFPVFCLQPPKKYAYSIQPQINTTTPDVRQNYLWEIIPVGTKTDFSFYLSDLSGTVEISVEGITRDNQVFKSSKLIEVK